MKTLTEWIRVDAVVADDDDVIVPHADLVFENMMAEWSGLPYAQLSVVLVHLRFLALVHQTHHWVAKGDTFYGDHLLFSRLYEKVVEEVDSIAERAVGMSGEQNVNLALQISQLARLSKNVGSPQTVPSTGDLARQSLIAECNFAKVLNTACTSLRDVGRESPGVENLLQGIADTHEGHVYLLKRRCASGPLGM